jgi:hypothetical protein
MSYPTPQRFGDEACSPRARGSGVWASRDPQAATSGQAATTTHTPGRQPGTTHANQTKIQLRPPLAAWHGAPMPLTAAPADSHPLPGWLRRPLRGGISRAHTGHYAAHRIPGLRRAGPQGHGGVSVAVPELSPPDPRLHHDGLPTQRFITRSRCR